MSDRREASAHKLLESMPDGVVISDAEGRIVYVNRRAEEITGYKRPELRGQRIELLVPRRLRSIHKKHRGDYTAKPSRRPMGSAERDFQVQRKDGSEISAEISLGPLTTADGPQVIAVIRDISERRRFEAALEHQALHDPLTDLANRTLFFDRLSQAINGARRDRKQVALVVLDLDKFKLVNDTFGHAQGDVVLKQLAARLVERMRATDTAARLGGDEFAWILPRMAGRAAAEHMVRDWLRAIDGTYSIRRKRIELAVSAGMALYPEDGGDAATLMRQADGALYSAKRSGGGFATVRLAC